MEVAGVTTENNQNPTSPTEDQPGTSGSGKGKEKKKIRFSPQENQILITEVIEHHHQLFITSTVSLRTKNTIWQSIVDKVNAVGVLRRTMEEVKRR